MDTMLAYAMSQSAGDRMMIFDWNKAAKLIRESGVKEASAGLKEDWGYTGGYIFRKGFPLLTNEDTYLTSNWAKPEIEVDGEIVECWVWKDEKKEYEEWGANTMWPDSALKILKEKADEYLK